MEVILYLFQQGGSVFIAMGGRCFQPYHPCFKILGNALSEAVDFSKLIFRIGIPLLRS